MNTLKIYIPRTLYEMFSVNFYNDSYIERFKLQFKAFFEQCMKEIEHPSLFTEWTRNLDEASYK